MGNSKNEHSKDKVYVCSASAPKNLLIPCVLLLLRRMSNYGYQIVHDLVEFGFSSIDPGYVYRILRQLESEKFVQSRWEVSSGGPPKRMYSITDVGNEYLDTWSQALEKYQYTLKRFFSMYERLLFSSTENKK